MLTFSTTWKIFLHRKTSSLLKFYSMLPHNNICFHGEVNAMMWKHLLSWWGKCYGVEAKITGCGSTCYLSRADAVMRNRVSSCGSKCYHPVNFDLESLRNIFQFIILFYHVILISVMVTRYFLLILKTLLTLIKKKTKFSSYPYMYREIQMGGIRCKVIFEEGLHNILGNVQLFNHLWGGH